MRITLERDAVRQAVAIPLAVVLSVLVVPYWPLAHGRYLMLGALLMAQVAAKEPLPRRLRILSAAAAASAALSAPFALLGPHPVLFAAGLFLLAFAANLLNATGKVDPRTTFFVLLLAMLSGGLAANAPPVTPPIGSNRLLSAGMAVDLPIALLGGGCLAAAAAAVSRLFLAPADPRDKVGEIMGLLAQKFEPVAAVLTHSASPGRSQSEADRLLLDLEQARDGLLLRAGQEAVDLPDRLDDGGVQDATRRVRLMRLARLVASSLDDTANIKDRVALAKLAPALPQLSSRLLTAMRAISLGLADHDPNALAKVKIPARTSLLTDPSLLARELPFSQAAVAYDLTANLEEMAGELTKLRACLMEDKPWPRRP
ncbi:MAG: hypothetical protein PWQ57_3217 [Desulfovibrionales bacterium]|jgi:hypothetical protein|nr:hypothetical protein [Desulfovibrionales bacterium]